MGDPRVTKLADVLINYSLEVKPGQLVQIQADAVSAPLVREAYRAVLQAGARPLLRLRVSGLDEITFKYASDEQLRAVSDLDRQEIETIDAFLLILGSENTKALTRADAAKVALRAKANHELNQRFYERASSGALTWAVTQFPTHSAAQDAEMSLSEYEDFVYGAGKLGHDDPVAAWKVVRAEQQRLADLLGARRVFRIVGPDTDLTYDTGGRSWINADGTRNFPDGEVFTSPDETKTEGYIRFSYPGVYAGREVADVRLEFKQGTVVQATAARGEELLHQLLGMDEARAGWARPPSAPTMKSSNLAAIFCSTKRSAAPFTWHWAKPLPKLVGKTARPYIGTWCAICARVAKSMPMACVSIATANL